MLPGSTIAEPGGIVTRLENFSNLVTSYQVTAYDQIEGVSDNFRDEFSDPESNLKLMAFAGVQFQVIGH